MQRRLPGSAPGSCPPRGRLGPGAHNARSPGTENTARAPSADPPRRAPAARKGGRGCAPRGPRLRTSEAGEKSGRSRRVEEGVPGEAENTGQGHRAKGEGPLRRGVSLGMRAARRVQRPWGWTRGLLVGGGPGTGRPGLGPERDRRPPEATSTVCFIQRFRVNWPRTLRQMTQTGGIKDSLPM